MVTVVLLKLSTVAFLRIPSYHPLSIIHHWSKSDSMPYPFLCWWHHLAFVNVIQQTPNPTRIKWLKAKWYRMLNFWSFTRFFSTSNTLNLSFTKTLNWQFHISSLAKSASKKLGVLWHFSLPLSSLLCTEVLSTHVWSMALMFVGAQLIQFY